MSMFFVEEKLEQRILELEKFRYRDVSKICPLLVCEDEQGVVNPVPPTDYRDWKEMQVGDCWEGRDRYLWLCTKITIPTSWSGKRSVGIFDFGKTGGGNNEGFEALLYVDGEPYQGVDSNHKEVFFREELAGKEVSLTFRLWSGLEGGGIPQIQKHEIKRADLGWLDEKTDDLYYLSKMMLETIKIMEEENPEKQMLRSGLDQAFRLLDWSEPGSLAFYSSVEAADTLLNEAVEHMGKHAQVTVYGIGHTHIDMAWLWRLKHTREKASRSFSTVLRLMEQYPEYIFLQTQPQLYAYIKEDFPEIYEKIKARIREKRWEVNGAMWVEADCNLISGESLTRQILLGKQFVKEEFDQDMTCLWLPDVFGYSWALPQILKKSGITTFMTTKISWNQYNRMLHDTFYWKGMDGSEVLTHFITTPDPDSQIGPWFYTYNGQLTPYTVQGVWKGYHEKDWNRELLISYGYGDGGGGVNRDALEQRRRLDKIPGLPEVKTGTAGAYFERLAKTAKETEHYVHTWNGELYLEYHRGTYTSHAYNKKMNRRLELLYREAEWMHVLGLLAGSRGEEDFEKLSEGWKIILRNQFHDIIPGSSIREVYEDSKEEYAQAEKLAEEVLKNAQEHLLAPETDTFTIWNAAGFVRSGLVKIPVGKKGSFWNQQGEMLPVQYVGEEAYVQLNAIPALGTRSIRFREEETTEQAAAFTVLEQGMETPFYQIYWNTCGQLTSIYDKENQREVLAEGQRGNVLQVFEDKPLAFDAWDIDLFYQEKMREITELQSIEVKELGSLFAAVEMVWNYGKSEVIQRLMLYADSRRIDFDTRINWQEQHQLLKAAFPVGIQNTYATYDIQYGNVRRPNHWNTSWDMARFESVAHRFVDLSEYNYGVSLLNDCKYGHDVKENVMRITLLKSAVNPDYMQDQGLHGFCYSLLPHKGDFIQGESVQEAFALNQPLRAVSGFRKEETGFISFSSELVELDAVKQSQNQKYLVVRFHEYAGSRQRVQVNLGVPFAAWAESDLMEKPLEAFRDGIIELDVKPYEIKTILICINGLHEKSEKHESGWRSVCVNLIK